jgi:hypothetical protein
MPKASDLTTDSRFMALFVGPSGDGKKSAACSWEALGPIKYFDLDLRIRGLLGSPWVKRDKIDYTSYPPKASTTLYERLNKDFEQLHNECITGTCKFKTVIIGSITGTTGGLLQDSLSISVPSEGGKTKTLGRSLGPLKIGGMENFRFVNNGALSIMSFLQSLPLNIIVLGHTVPVWELEDEDDPYGPKKITGHKLSLSDTLGAIIPGKFDNVWRFERKITGSGSSTRVKFEVEFRGQFARTTYKDLPNTMDVTGVNLYETIQTKLLGGLVK